jgi:protein ImuA
MAQPTALTANRNRAEVAAELRRLLPRIQAVNTANALPFGVAAIDDYLPQGGLAGGGLHEFVPEAGASPAAFGFIVALLARIVSPPPTGSCLSRARPQACGEGLGVGVVRRLAGVNVFACPHDPPPYPPPQGGRERIFLILPSYGTRDFGRPYGHGLSALGLHPRRVILVETAHRKETLWAIEEALHSGAPAAVAGAIDKLDLKSSQRLQLAAADAGLPLLLLRPAQNLESSAAATRWRIGARAAARDRFGLFARPRWHLHLERCRNGRPGEWLVEYDHVAHCFSLAAALADHALSRSAGENPLRQARRS